MHVDFRHLSDEEADSLRESVVSGERSLFDALRGNLKSGPIEGDDDSEELSDDDDDCWGDDEDDDYCGDDDDDDDECW
jgi:hypothetical protein